MRIIKRLTLSLIFISLNCCIVRKDTFQAYDVRSKVEDHLRVDGYYFKEGERVSSMYKEPLKSLYTFFLYEDGSMVWLSATGSIDQEGIVKDRTTEESHNSFQKSLSNFDLLYQDWGKYSVAEDLLKIQLSKKVSRGLFPVITEFIKYHGLILDDSTIQISTLHEDRHGISGVYHFKKYSPKPDSLNWIDKKIKKKESDH